MSTTKLRIMSVVGARPNFMKIAPLAREFRRFEGIAHVLVHSGQHYSSELSSSFFQDLEIPEPEVNLAVGSGTQAWQTAEIMKRFEPVVQNWKPDLIVVVGDVNSTLAAALVAAKLGIPIAHVEAGLRSFDMSMPEEINRKLTDAVSNFLFVTEESGVRNLKNEGISSDRVFLVGNVMIDTLLGFQKRAAESKILEELGLSEKGGPVRSFAVLTLHRPANVDDPQVLGEILEAVRTLSNELPVLFPIHPRSRERIDSFGLGANLREATDAIEMGGIFALPPLGYLDFLNLMSNARMMLTDSGGIQEETTVLGIPCLTLRDNTERPVTITHGTNQLVGRSKGSILAAGRAILSGPRRSASRPPLWDGQAAQRIVRILVENLRPGLVERTAARLTRPVAS